MKPMRARARSTDPNTSHEAAFRVEKGGKASTQREMCLREALRCPGQTASEIAVALGIERIIPGKRLPELREAGFIENGPERICKIRGTMCMTWVPAAKEEGLEQRELFRADHMKAHQDAQRYSRGAWMADRYES